MRLVGFIIRNLSRGTVTWTSNCQNILMAYIKVHGFRPNEMQHWRSIRFQVWNAKMQVAHSYAHMSPACWCNGLVNVLRAYRWTKPMCKGEWLVTVRQNAVSAYRLKYHKLILLFDGLWVKVDPLDCTMCTISPRCRIQEPHTSYQV